jgi:hypothetical protein
MQAKGAIMSNLPRSKRTFGYGITVNGKVRKQGYKSKLTAYLALDMLKRAMPIDNFKVFKIDSTGYHVVQTWENVNEQSKPMFEM